MASPKRRAGTSLKPGIVLIDGHNMIHRAAYGYPAAIMNSRGVDVTAEFGFMTLVRAALKSIPGEAAVVAVFDGPDGAARRREIYPEYKPQAPDGDPFASRIRTIETLLAHAGAGFYQHVDYEADDVMAALAVGRDGLHEQARVFIVSNDQDFYALLSEKTVVVNSMRKVEKRNIDRTEIVSRFGVGPEQWQLFKALVGDKSDGITGIRGIGPKKAAALLVNATSAAELSPQLTDEQITQVALWKRLMEFESVPQVEREKVVYASELAFTYDSFPRAQTLFDAADLW